MEKRKLSKELSPQEIKESELFGKIIPLVYTLDDEEVIHQFLELDGKPYGDQPDKELLEMDWPNSMLDKYEYAEISKILDDPDWYIGDGKFDKKVIAVIRRIVAERFGWGVEPYGN